MNSAETGVVVETDRPSPSAHRALPIVALWRVRWPAIFAALSAALVFTRFVGYHQSLWEDEIYTVRHYIVLGPAGSFGHYGTNDHILFSILSWLTIYLPGLSDSAYRLWSIVPFIAAISLTTFWLSRRVDRVVGLLYAVLATASPLLLTLTTEARGYGLAFLAMAVMTIAAYEARAEGAGLGWLSVFVVAGVIGTWTLPTFVLPFAGAAGALLVFQRDKRLEVLRRLAAASLAIGLFYAVPAAALWESRGQQFGTQLPWHAPVTGSVTEFIAAFIPQITTAGPWVQGTLIAAVAPMLVLGCMTAHRRMPNIAAVTIAPVIVTYLALTGGRLFVEPRFVSYLLMPLFVWAAFGLKALFASKKLWLATATYAGTILTIVGVFGFAAAKNERLPLQANREAAREVVDALGDSPGIVVLNTVDPRDIRYYLPQGLPIASFAPSKLQQLVCSRERSGRLILVQQFTAAVRPVKTGCLQGRNATRRLFKQRGYGGWIGVWSIDAARPPRG